MARPLPIEFAGAWYHLTSRDNERKLIFSDDWERRKILEIPAMQVGNKWSPLTIFLEGYRSFKTPEEHSVGDGCHPELITNSNPSSYEKPR